MEYIKCVLADTNGDYPELDELEILLPAIPIKGNDNFDIKHKEEIYNCSVHDVDWFIEDGIFKYCTIYIK